MYIRIQEEDGVTRATCTRDGWEPNPLCEANHDNCSPPPKVENAVINTTCYRKQYPSGSEVTYQCPEKKKYMTGEIIEYQCAQGCGRPPPLSDGDTKTSTKQLYQHNEKVEYICQRYYVMKGGPFKTCNHGEWTGEIRCLRK
uniref:Sushi domain-containing protein n=1 Tax=Maylandia zebra TaxID=106582 RepID=A0A3P9BZ80_9CICH